MSAKAFVPEDVQGVQININGDSPIVAKKLQQEMLHLPFIRATTNLFDLYLILLLLPPSYPMLLLIILYTPHRHCVWKHRVLSSLGALRGVLLPHPE